MIRSASFGLNARVAALSFALASLAMLFTQSASAQSVTLSSPSSSSTQVDSTTVSYTVSEPAGAPQAIQIVFTCSSGPCLSASWGTVMTLSMKAAFLVSGSKSFTASFTGLNSSSNDFTPSPSGVSLAEGVYTAYCQYVRPASAGGTTLRSTTRTNILFDVNTQTPRLYLPAAGGSASSEVRVSYVLSEGYLSGSASLSFVGPVTNTFVLPDNRLTGGQFPDGGVPDGGLPGYPLVDAGDGGSLIYLPYFTVDTRHVTTSLYPVDPAAADAGLGREGGTNANITSATSTTLPDGTYTVTLSYQDRFSHPASTAASSNFLIQTSTPTPSISSPPALADAGAEPIDGAHYDDAGSRVYDLPLVISYLLPSQPATGTAVLTLSPGGYSFTLPNTYGSVQSFTVPTSVPAGTYTAAITYQDFLNNPAASTSVAGVEVVRADMQVSASHTGTFTRGLPQSYSIVVSNSGASASSGAVSVDVTLPTGLTATGLSGTGWTCDLAIMRCSRIASDALQGYASFPAITMSVLVDSDAPLLLEPVFDVAGGNEDVTDNNSSSDPTVVACGSGTYAEDDDCTACDACATGTYEVLACSAVSNRECAACAAVTNCATPLCADEESSTCAVCNTGYFVRAGACVPCSGACPSGAYELTACSATADRICDSCTALPNCALSTCTALGDETCSRCATGYFASDDSCTACSGACPDGQYRSAACTPESDRVCSACPSSCATCEDASTRCTSCPSGTFLADGVCVTCRTCAPGTRQTVACSETANTECEDCAAGTFSDTAGATACTSCPANTFAVNAGSTACRACASGTYSAEGQNACSACGPDSDPEVCPTCEAGSYLLPDLSTCAPCPVGTASAAGARACTACEPGSSASSTGATACDTCVAGTYAVSPGSTECTSCPAGTFADAAAATRCTVCPVGTYSPSEGQTSCTACESCDDSNECTRDVCELIDGCTHAAIDGCVLPMDAGAMEDGAVNDGAADDGATDDAQSNDSAVIGADGSSSNIDDGAISLPDATIDITPTSSGCDCATSHGRGGAAASVWSILAGAFVLATLRRRSSRR